MSDLIKHDNRTENHRQYGERWGCHRERTGWPLDKDTEVGENSML